MPFIYKDTVVRTGILGETLPNGIVTVEKNRATVWEWTAAGLDALCKIAQDNYISKGVEAAVFGVYVGPRAKYAVFVEDGFLREVSDED